MPELPEVELTRLSLADRILGATVLSMRMGKPLRWPLGRAPSELPGCRIGAVSRRGKYLWLPLERPVNGQLIDEGGLLVHLGMSGSLSFATYAPEAGPHDHMDMMTTQGTLRLNDPRRFGAVSWGAALNRGLPQKLLAGLGLEPFDSALTGDYLHDKLKGRKVAIKQALLAGDIVVGAGNIYACEALFRAGIHPGLAASRLSRPRCQRLVTEVQAVLRQALDAGGSTLRNFKDANGSPGHFQLVTRVYGRAGQACWVCTTPVRRVVQGQRGTFFCPVCQRK